MSLSVHQKKPMAKVVLLISVMFFAVSSMASELTSKDDAKNAAKNGAKNGARNKVNNTQEAREEVKLEKTASTTATADHYFSIADYGQLNALTQKEVAASFRLTAPQYQQYAEIMQSHYLGQRYKGMNLDPNYVLAEYALIQGDEAQADRYVENLVRLEHAAVSRQLKLQVKFQQTAFRLFPSETPIKLQGEVPMGYTTFGHQPVPENFMQTGMDFIQSMKIEGNTTYVLLIDTANDLSKQENRQLTQFVQKLSLLPNTRLDIYFLNTVTEDDIVGWVRSKDLAQSVLNKQVTVNFKGQFVDAFAQMLGRDVKAGELFKNDSGNYIALNWD
ncbi:hypothetical protein [Cysteiniphilum marinum]|uniref:hypothetical protein n=1 Tax=Cysteiniphilum marinum TaxID=2774191 RepID=UPI00193B9392|nr:hypothetical protein [Cysteiniphilum marinum]